MPPEIRSRVYTLGSFRFSSGETLPGMQLAYETYGTLSADGSNAVLLLHALTGSHHAYGTNNCLPEAGAFWQPENYSGWWNGMIGPDKPLDTEKYCIICANYIGSCYGSSGPTSAAPDGEPWGSRFPMITAADQAHAFVQLMHHLGVRKFRIVGPSVGGLVGLVLAGLYPQAVRSMVLIGAAQKPLIGHKLAAFEQTLAIELDPAFCGGRYALNSPPLRGLTLARIICHKHFVYQYGLQARSRRGGVRPHEGNFPAWYTPQSSTESYMLHQGTKFSRRFDANAYIRIIRMWTDYDLPTQTGAARESDVFARYLQADIPFLLYSINTDCCFPPRAVSQLHRALLRAGVKSKYERIHSTKGHDSFLIEPELYDAGIRHHLAL